MNVQKILYECFLRLGVDMIHPQGYVCSKAPRSPDLVFGFLRWDNGGMYVLLANYLMVDGQALPEPEVMLWISPREKRAVAVTCEWPNEKEVASPALDAQVFAWLELQIMRGHHFRGLQKMEGNVVALHSVRRRILQLQEGMTDKELYRLTHPETWPHKGLLPLARRGGDVIYNDRDAGIVMKDNLCRVWTGVYLGESDPRDGTPVDYPSHEALLSEWEIVPTNRCGYIKIRVLFTYEVPLCVALKSMTNLLASYPCFAP
jgi:hypothetical protein